MQTDTRDAPYQLKSNLVSQLQARRQEMKWGCFVKKGKMGCFVKKSGKWGVFCKKVEYGVCGPFLNAGCIM